MQHLSIGYQVDEWRDGTDAQGNRTRTAVKWTIREASFVSVPADRRARTRTARLRAARALRSIAALGPMPASGCERRCGRRPYRPRGQHRRRARRDSRHLDCARHGVSLSAARTTCIRPTIPRCSCALRARRCIFALHRAFSRAGRRGNFQHAHPGDRARVSTAQGVNMTALGGPELVTRALHTTCDFPLILGDTVGRTLRESYSAAPSGIRQLARQTTAADFRAKSRLMLDSSGHDLGEGQRARRIQVGHHGRGRRELHGRHLRQDLRHLPQGAGER